MTTATDHIVQAFLEDGGYTTVEEWAEDSDYVLEPESGDWYVADDWYGRDGRKPEPLPVDIYGCIEGAIEACGFEVKTFASLNADERHAVLFDGWV